MVLISLIGGGTTLGILITGQTLTMEENIIREHLVIADIVSQTIETGYFAGRWPFETLEELKKGEDIVFWWVTKPDGEIVLADNPDMWGKQVTNNFLYSNETIVRDTVFSETGENIKVIVRPLNIKEEGKNWMFCMGVSLKPISMARNSLIQNGIAILIGVVFLTVVFSFILSRSIIKPIQQLSKATITIAKGNLDQHVEVESNGEIGLLANNFNKMIQELRESKTKLEEYNKLLEKKVEERTKELRIAKEKLEEHVEKLERNKKMLLNLMQDLKNTVDKLKTTQEELKHRNKELEIAHNKLKEMNRELDRKVKERTREVEKLLEQKNEFIHQLGHDLKTPLTPMLTLLPIIRNHVDDPKTQELLDILVESSSYMKELVTKTLQLARLNSPNMQFQIEEVNLREEINSALERNKTILQDCNIEVENLVREDVLVMADKLRLGELLDNLISNAVKYTPNGGRITITADYEEDEVKIAIQDTGIGMTREQIEHIFDEFYKADASRHDLDSSGLGLAICKRIVEKHGGRIWAESPGKGKGSTFYFTLPCSSNLEDRTCEPIAFAKKMK